MANNRGKQWEKMFAQCWKQTFPDGTLDRLYDSVSGFKNISNISDFIGYVKPNIFYLECKSHEGNTFPWTALTQYPKLAAKVGIPGVRAGVVLWMIDHDKVIYLPISSVTKMMEDGKKSFNIKMLESDEYTVFDIPSTKKKVFMESDFSMLHNLEDGQ